MSLHKLPTEVLHAIFQDVATFGSPELVACTRASRGLYAITNPILYSTDVLESGGAKSLNHGLKHELNKVVKLCLIAGVDPNLRISSHHDLDCSYRPLPRRPSHLPKESNCSLMHIPRLDAHPQNRSNAHGPTISGFNSDYIPAIPALDNTPDYLSSPHLWAKKVHYWTPLHVAATRNDIELLSILLDHGANPNMAGRGVCPCHYLPLRRTVGRFTSFHEGNLEVITKRLVIRWSPIHVAVCKGNLDCAEMLIDRFGLAHATESDDAVLAEARRFVRKEPTLPQLPLRSLLDTRTPRFDPLPPLHVAADKYETVEALERVYAMLERAGCLKDSNRGVDVLDAFGDTPFAIAAFSGRIQLFGSWFRDRGADINFVLNASLSRVDEHRSVFNALCQSGLFKAASFLMDMGIDTHLDNELHSGGRHRSALHFCCGYDLYDDEEMTWNERQSPVKQVEAIVLIKRLIQDGLNIDTRSEQDGTTALMIAARLNFTAALRELLEAKADIEAVDDCGSSALHYAIASRLSGKPGRGPGLSAELFTIQILLDNGADPNQNCQPEFSAPPLFDLKGCVRDNDTQKIASIGSLLLSRGADPNFYQRGTRVPWDIESGGLTGEPDKTRAKSLVVSAFSDGNFGFLDSLVRWGALVTCRDYLLMMRSLVIEDERPHGSNSAAVEALFRLLQCPSLMWELPDRTKIMDAWTEVLYHAVGSRPGLVHALAPHVSLTDICGPGGKNVLHLMARWQQKPKEEPAQFAKRVDGMMVDLLRCGAGRLIDQPDNFGQSPLATAVERGNNPVASSLLNLGAAFCFEQKGPNGSAVICPLRSAIRCYSKARQYEIAAEMLSICDSHIKLAIQVCDSTGYLKDLVLHFGGNPFDKTADVEPRTVELFGKLMKLGVGVNEPDEHGDTALHLLLQLLYSSHEICRDSDDLPVPHSFSPTWSLGSSSGPQRVFDTGPDRLLDFPDDWDMNMNGWNIEYHDDSDYGVSPAPDDFNDEISGSIYGSAIADNYSDIGNEVVVSLNELGESVEDDSGIVPQRCCAWMSLFFLLLTRGASLRMRNSAGKTVIHHIDELRKGEAHDCPKMYSPIIPVLRNFVKRPPFDHELLASLDESEVKIKGPPQLFIHDHIRRCLDEYIPRGRGPWVPFW